MPNELINHPAADFLPKLSEAEFEELKADIAKRGLREPILKFGNVLIDGRHRLRACSELGIEPTFQEFNGERDFMGEIFSRNVLRRHLTTSERAEVAAKLANIPHGGDRRSNQAAILPLEKISIKQAASALKVSERSVRAAKRRLTKVKPRPHAPKQVDRTRPEYVVKKFQQFMDRWPVTQHRAIKKVIHDYTA